MNIVILFGNGLDLGVGLKTAYPDFYMYLMERAKSDSDLAENSIYKILDKDVKNNNVNLWSDFECRLGTITEEFNDSMKKQLDDDKIYIDQCLKDYLKKENEKINTFHIDGKISLKKALPEICKCITPDNTDKVTSIFSKHKTETFSLFAISFNYTDIVKKVFSLARDSIFYEKIASYPLGSGIYLNPPFYLHGNLLDGDMIIGVNDSSQIKNSSYADDALVQNALIKSELQKQSGQQRIKRFKELIEQSNLIFMYGLSIGASDKEYWRLIKERLLKDDSLLVIYCHEEASKVEHIRLRTRVTDQVKNTFYRNSDANEEEIKIIGNKIVVEINHDIFSKDVIISK